MKKSALIALATTLSLVNVAQAENLYVKGNLGYGFGEKKIKSAGTDYKLERKKQSGNYSVTAGMKVAPELSGEIELGRYKNTLTNTSNQAKTDITNYSAMLNGVYELDAGALKPYVKAGMGFTRSKLNSKSKNAFAWNIGTGANYYVTKNVAVNVDYRYLNGNKFKVGNDSFKNNNHQVALGLRFDF